MSLKQSKKKDIDDPSTNATANKEVNLDDISLSNVEKLRIFIGSWNVGNKMPPKGHGALDAWIPAGGGSFDVIAIGLQESSYKEKKDAVEEEKSDGSDDESAEPPLNNHTPNSKHSPHHSSPAHSPGHGANTSDARKSILAAPAETLLEILEYPFFHQLEAHLGENYHPPTKVELMEMRLILFLHKKHEVKSIEKATEATGVGSVIGNKGGVVVSAVVGDTHLCFVSCHLAAHEAEKFLEKRNSDCQEILAGARVGNKLVSVASQFHHVFWLGDLNYRIDLNITEPKEREHSAHWNQVVDLINTKQWDKLSQNDQLSKQVAEKKALSGWNLAPVDFAPTFKVVRGKLQEYSKQRIPSYCDRILWKSLAGEADKIKLIEFNSVPDITTSDHKPVFGVFEVTPAQKVTECADLSKWVKVCITDLKGCDLRAMDLNGSSDPYINFITVPHALIGATGSSTAHILDLNRQKTPSTSVINNTLRPIWKNEQVPPLKIKVSGANDLKGLHLVLNVMDYDATSADDQLGECVLYLGAYIPGRVTEFAQEILLNGKPSGIIEGKIQIISSDDKDPEKSKESQAHPASCCSIL